VGHPLADQIPMQVNKQEARRTLGIAEQGPLIALLPGSRASEISRLAAPFIATAQWCLKRKQALQFLVAVIDPETRDLFSAALQKQGTALPITIIEGRSHEAMAAADVVLLASGTATLEAMLLKRPMVVAYSMAPMTHFIAKKMVKLPYYSLPNLLAGRRLVPELIQDQVTPENIGPLLLDWLDAQEKTEATMEEFKKIHEELQINASATAANAVLEVATR